MAFFDNQHWLLTHIRNSFISSDGTGMCEAVLIDDVTKQSSHFEEFEKYPNLEESSEEEDELSHSFDIQSEYELGIHRHRTNTAQRLEKMEQEKRKAAKIKHVKWENNPRPLTAAELGVLFERKEVKKKDKDKKVVSLLADEIAKYPCLPKNPFNEYAKFDGNAQVGVLTRTYRIFLTMLPPSERAFPLNVCVLGSAKVQELIGFVCWKYLTQNIERNITFKDVNSYGLYIAEDDGEVDWDFSCLDPKETVGKFGLAYLALVELSEREIRHETERLDTIRTIRNIESDSQKTATLEAELKLKGDLTAIEALLYQSFQVSMVSKMRARSEVSLGVSGDKIEIDPILQNQTKVGGKLWRPKSYSYNIELIVSCAIVESKSSNKTIFRLVYYNTSTVSPDQSGSLSQSGSSHFKHHDFEAEHNTAEEIVQKINHVLHLKTGALQREYLAFKQKKSSRRRSFSLWPR